MRASPIHLSFSENKPQSAILDNLKAVTKGEEKVREVKLRGRQMPYEYVLTAMFENQDFMPNSDEVQLKSTPQMVDQSAHPVRSHFGPPPPSPLGLGMDVRRHSSKSVSVAEKGGLYEE